MVLTSKALEKLSKLEATDTSDVLNKFSGKEEIADCAVNSLANLVEQGLNAGSEGTEIIKIL